MSTWSYEPAPKGHKRNRSDNPFEERVSLTGRNGEQKIIVQKCLVLVSRYSYFEASKKLIMNLYEIA